ncbi:hotdog domain-containing protein [Rhodococcus sp. NPDC054953]
MSIATDLRETPQSLFGVGRPVRDGATARMAMAVTGSAGGTAMLGVLIDDLLGVAFYDRRGDHDGIVGAELSISYARPTGWRGPVLTAEAHIESIDDDGGLGVLQVLDADGTPLASATMWGTFVDGVSQNRTLHGAPDPAPTPPAAAAAPLDILGGTIERTETGALLTVTGSPALANTMGKMHGGIHACGHDLVAAAAAPGMRTAALRANYFRPGSLDGEIVFEAFPVQVGRRIAVIRTEARDATGQVCSAATITLRREAAAAAERPAPEC